MSRNHSIGMQVLWTKKELSRGQIRTKCRIAMSGGQVTLDNCAPGNESQKELDKLQYIFKILDITKGDGRYGNELDAGSNKKALFLWNFSSTMSARHFGRGCSLSVVTIQPTGILLRGGEGEISKC